MKVFLENKVVEAAEGAKISEILVSQGINPEAVIVKRGNEVAGDFEEVKDGDRLELIRVVSGG